MCSRNGVNLRLYRSYEADNKSPGKGIEALSFLTEQNCSGEIFSLQVKRPSPKDNLFLP